MFLHSSYWPLRILSKCNMCVQFSGSIGLLYIVTMVKHYNRQLMTLTHDDCIPLILLVNLQHAVSFVPINGVKLTHPPSNRTSTGLTAVFIWRQKKLVRRSTSMIYNDMKFSPPICVFRTSYRTSKQYVVWLFPWSSVMVKYIVSYVLGKIRC